MDWSAHNAGFVAAAYAVSAICIVGLVLWIWRKDRERARQLKNTKD
ncbi:MAG: heme exporter protein CcmD [Aestuariivirga sp.]